MNKKFILASSTICGLVGAYVPVLFGDIDMLGGASILGGFIGGMFGVWVGAVLSKRVG